MDNPELEFQKTALAACRSNITQLETELKRLKETSSIKDKRILQLESQIGHASELFASRNIPTDPNNHLEAVLKRLENIENKLNVLILPSPNNIVINTYKAEPTNHTQVTQSASTPTQTDHPINNRDDNSETVAAPSTTMSDNEDSQVPPTCL